MMNDNKKIDRLTIEDAQKLRKHRNMETIVNILKEQPLPDVAKLRGDMKLEKVNTYIDKETIQNYMK